MEVNITEFVIKITAIYEDDSAFRFHNLRSIAKSQQKILQTPYGLAGDFSTWILSSEPVACQASWASVVFHNSNGGVDLLLWRIRSSSFSVSSHERSLHAPAKSNAVCVASSDTVLSAWVSSEKRYRLDFYVHARLEANLGEYINNSR